MSDDEQTLAAIDFVKENKNIFFDKLVEGTNCETSDNPVAVFMAGTPGAGKTEVAKSLISLFEIEPLRIDADEFRSMIPGYNGANSYIVQPAASLAVDKVMDKVYEKRLPFILDGTFAVGKASMNIKRAIRREYETQIYFVYQDPVEAWSFTKIREQQEGRHVPKEVFINAYFLSRQNVRDVKKEFGDQVTLQLIIKNYKTGEHSVIVNIEDIDKYLPKLYTEDELGALLV